MKRVSKVAWSLIALATASLLTLPVIAQEGWLSASPAPRVALYGTVQEALQARDLYGALEVLPSLPEATPETTGMTPRYQAVLDAAAHGCVRVLAELVHAGQKLYEPGMATTSALHLAAEAGHLYTANFLTWSGVDIAGFDQRGFSPAHAAAGAGHADVVQSLIFNGFNANMLAKESSGRQPHVVALDAGQFDVTRLYRRMGYDLRIFLSTTAGDLDAIRDTIKARPTELEETDGLKNTPLLAAIVAGREEAMKLLIELGAQLDPINLEGRGPISVAIQHRHPQLIPILVEAGASIEVLCNDYSKRSLMHDAVIEGSLDDIKLLHELGAKVDLKDREGFTPLHRAVELQIEAKAQYLLELGANPDTQDRRSRSLAHTAVEKGSRTMLALALAHATDSCTWDENRQTPLHYAAERGHTELLADLLAAGELVNLRDLRGRTPLMLAAAARQLDALSHLIGHGVALDTLDVSGRTALHHAVLAGFQVGVERLLAAGAPMDTLDLEGYPAVYYALRDEQADIFLALQEAGAKLDLTLPGSRTLLYATCHEETTSMTQRLLDAGFDVNVSDETGWTPLHQAAQVGTELTINLLLSRGAEPNARDAEDRTPLHVASKRGHILIVKALTSGGADDKLSDKNGWLPIHYAAYAGHWGPIQFYLLRDASINAALPDGRTLLHLSSESGMVRTAMLLIGKNADLLQLDAQGRTPLALVEEQPGVRDKLSARTPKDAERELSTQAMLNYLRLATCELLSRLIESGDVERAALLLEKHPQFANIAFHGLTPLHQAVQRGEQSMVQLLLDHGADPKAKDEVGTARTPLHEAALLNSNIAKVLASHAPEVLLATDAEGNTPAMLARAAGQEELARELSPPAT